MNIHFIRSAEKKKIIQSLNEQFGVEDLPYLLVESGKEKIRLFSGHLSKEEIMQISQLANLEVLGLYGIKVEGDYRLSIDSTHILSQQLTKNIVEINDEQVNDWLRGNDLDIKCERATVIIKYKDYFLGCGKSNGEKIFNYVPKDRRLRSKQ